MNFLTLVLNAEKFLGNVCVMYNVHTHTVQRIHNANEISNTENVLGMVERFDYELGTR